MCGILGVIDLQNNHSFNPATIFPMGDAMSHRGPDGDGFLFVGEQDFGEVKEIGKGRPKTLTLTRPHKNSFVFAHRRLSIIDLSSVANQPMADEKEEVWIVFNGEIYNHAEIRSELEKKGYQFNTSHSDTEMILNAYKEWGIKAIDQFRGMFAFALWDARTDDFYLVRDRIGIKPLYYTQQNGQFYFASEIKAILKDPTIKRRPNFPGIYDYFTFLTVPAPDTFYEGIHKIPAGHYIHIKNRKVSKTIEYWDVYDNVEMQYDKSEEEIKERLLEELKTAVKYRTIGDVPVGVFLSGGVDSSVNASLFNQVEDKQIKTFSIGYENADSYRHTNEFKYARQIANDIKSDHFELELTQQNLLDFLPDLVHYQDEPIADPVCLPVYFVSKLARDNGVTVCQVGEGADELFWGYKYWKDMLSLQQMNSLPVPNMLKKAGLKGMDMAGFGKTFPYELLRRAAHKEPIFWSGITAFGEQEKEGLLNGAFKKNLQGYRTQETIQRYYKQYQERAKEDSFINWMAYINFKIRLPELLLMRVDKMAMAVSLEARVPFLDHHFVEYAMGIPAALKTTNKESKYILKKSVEGLLPQDIIYRKKQGFSVPIYEWFMDDLGKVAREKIDAFNKDMGLFEPKELKRLYDKKHGNKVWYLLNFVLWWEANLQ